MTLPAPVLDDAPDLLTLLTQQRDLYHNLKRLSDRQAGLIAEGHTDDLLSVLAQRQRLVEALTRLNADVSACRRRTDDLHQSLDAEDRDQINQRVEEVESLLEQIIEQDDRDRRQLETAQQQVGVQIKQSARGGAAHVAYRGATQSVAQAAARFTDRQG